MKKYSNSSFIRYVMRTWRQVPRELWENFMEEA